MEPTLIGVFKLALGAFALPGLRHVTFPPEPAADPPRLFLPLPPRAGQPPVAEVKRRRAPPAPPMAPRAAAKAFVRWMQEHDFLGERPWSGPDGIEAMYLGWHCHDINVTPTSPNLFAEALQHVITRRQVSVYVNGRRHRTWRYSIPALPDEVAQAEKPRRKRAA